ncbi:MAG TPA: condensation domain-containing protein, partial [Pyrinomonadaceae bacterium]
MAEKIDPSQRLSQLSADKRSLLEKLIRKGGTAAGAGSITRRESDSPTPLSYAQQRLWFLAQLEPGKPLYNITRKFFIKGPLNVPVLEQSLDEIIRRHEILRTTFARKDGDPVQIVHPFHAVSLSVVDLTGYEEGEREAEVERLTASLARSPIDLERGPLFKTLLLRLGEEEHVLCLTLHHIICDAWSVGLLYSELSALYSAFAGGDSSPLAELPIQYADYADWQRREDSAGANDEALRYWRRKLSGAPPALELPADRPRPADRGLSGATLGVALGGGLARRLSELGRGAGATTHMVLLAGFAALLSRYGGRREVVVGSPV